MEMLSIIGGLISIAGAVFLFIAALGLLRMPDVYNRMQAGTKATTLGSILFLLGIGVAIPGWLPKTLILVLFIVFTNPISSHALIRAAHHAGLPLARETVQDDLVSARGGAGGDAAGSEYTSPQQARPGVMGQSEQGQGAET